MTRPYLADRIRRSLVVLTVLAFPTCGDGTSTPGTNPLPVLLGVSPPQLVAGVGATTLTLTGSGFIPASQARWNDGDRVTHYQDPQTLTVDLPASDVASLTTAKLTVVNGAPGGGTSGSITVSVGYPTPHITAVSPNTTPVPSGSTPLTLTITGTGFVTQSSVRLGTLFLIPSSVTATQIVTSVPVSSLGTPGTLALTVVNPTPGGGTSNVADFSITYPVPTITTLSPDSSFTGSAFTLTVNGTGFGTGSVVRWNDDARPTTFVSSTRLTAAISTSDVASATTAMVSVFNPTPGGGAANALPYRVVELGPVITGIDPGVITVGAATPMVTVTGTNFRSGATAQWNGSNRSATLVSGTSMTVTLNASDVATPNVGRLTVTNVGASGTSNAMAVAVIASGASMSVVRTISLTHADLVYDELRGALYASVPSTASQNANSVVRIDPASGAITGTVAVGSNPATMAITDDGQFLYVALLGAPTIVRVALTSFSKDIDIALRVDSFFGSTFAEDLVPIPGAPQTIAASTYYTGVSPRNAGTFVFENATRRASGAPGHTGSNRITRGPTAARIYGYNNETTEFGFRSVLVAADGLHEETVKAGLVSGFGVDIEYGGGMVYATTGEVVDVANMSKVGTIPTTGIVRPDPANARVHFLNGTIIRTYHYTTFTSLGSFTDVSLGSHTKLIRWGTDGLAVGGGTSIVLVRGGLVAP